MLLSLEYWDFLQQIRMRYFAPLKISDGIIISEDWTLFDIKTLPVKAYSVKGINVNKCRSLFISHVNNLSF